MKHGVYERARVPEYWLVDPGGRSVEIFRLEGGSFRPAGYLEESGVVRTSQLPGVEVDVGRHFG